MALAPVPDDALQETVSLYLANGNNQQKTADALGLARSTVQNRLTQAARKGLLPPAVPAMPGFEVTRLQTGPRGTTIEQRPEKGEVFEIPDGHRIKGVSAFIDPDGRLRGQWVKTREGEIDLDTIVSQVAEALKEHEGRSAAIHAPEHVDDDLSTVYVLPDAHLGMMAWEKETGKNYDLKIAEDIIKQSLDRLFRSTPKSGTGVVLSLGDLLHFDGYEPVTSRSRNILDADGRYPKVLKVATSILIWKVDNALAKHERVIVRILPGNHDDQSAIAVSLALAMYYRNNDRVTVDEDPSRFWWWRFGNTFLGATHGDMTKMQDMPLIMAASRPEDWGASKYRVILTGHIHHKSAIEQGGVIVESFQSPAARDAWHAASGYNSGRSLSAITFHREFGEVSRQKVNIV
ncbi:PucR family transcriptional regulator [Sinorhizobium meliloti]|uniref:helix-turn-helix domain-containing protein n=1 Tax=Rhizobium meliloti TaxID=382 RepID=UPI000B4A063D|nr:helix-turn-helix domain-containing protein [Sinorhizobium meliloti]ASQ10234.1 PucR family transcriptional regulator [Sinorhizobium meliloti]MQU85704.1 hypothetical protein [Sinorhizobium meliloti]